MYDTMMLSQKYIRVLLIILLALLSIKGLKAQDVQILLDSLQIKEKEGQRDCRYLENLFDIGNCYKELKQYSKAEYYYRKVIIEGDILNIDCPIKNQTLNKMAELYNATGYPIFADYCTSMTDNKTTFENTGDYFDRLNELTSLYDAYESQGRIKECVQTLRKILDHIKVNRGKYDTGYIIYAEILGSILSRELNMQEEAAELDREVITIGESLKSYHVSVYLAYETYLNYLSRKNEVDSIEYYLPKVIDYMNHIKDSFSERRNLYEEIGWNLYEAKNVEEGIKYLERPWNGETANSIKSSTILGNYYIKKDIHKAIFYYNKAFAITEKDSTFVTDMTRKNISEILMYLYAKVDSLYEAINFGEIAGRYIGESEDYDNLASHLMYLGGIYLKAKEFDKAQDIILKINPILNHLTIDKNIDFFYYCGFVYLGSRDYNKAIDIYEYGIKYIIDNKGNRDKELITIYNNLGYIYMQKQDFKKALYNLNSSKELQVELNGEVMQSTMDYIKECLEK